MKSRLLFYYVVLILAFLLLAVACSSTAVGNETVVQPVENDRVEEEKENPEESVSPNEIVFSGDKGRFRLVLSKADMSAKLYHAGLQVKEGYWTCASAVLGANIVIYIDEKPLNLFLDPTTNEYSIDLTYETFSDTLRCDFNSWYGKARGFVSLPMHEGEIVMYGASNFAYWTTMKTDLDPYLVHNHSVGGLTDGQLLKAAPKLLYPFKPSVVVMLAGSNDYANIEDVSDVEAIVSEIMKVKTDMYVQFHENLPDAKIVAVGGFPTVSREKYTPIILRVNEELEKLCGRYDFMTYCSTDGLTYNADTGEYRSEQFLADNLHLTPEARLELAELIKPSLELIDAPAHKVVNEPEKHMLYSSADEIPFYDGKAEEPFYISYTVQSDEPSRALVIFHGGGFMARSLPKEGEAIAEYFSREHGYACFVCYYRISTDYRGIVSDGIRFVKDIRSKAGQYNIDPNGICIVGFSAGGSLALMESQHYADEEYGFADETGAVDGRPDYLCLLYPGSSFMSPKNNRFFRSDYSEELAAQYDPALNVMEGTGPVFIAQAKDDATTPIEGTYRLLDALKQKDVDCEFHEFSHGDHGFALGNNEETVQWRELFAAWLDEK